MYLGLLMNVFIFGHIDKLYYRDIYGNKSEKMYIPQHYNKTPADIHNYILYTFLCEIEVNVFKIYKHCMLMRFC